jgi:hypothetical protein
VLYLRAACCTGPELGCSASPTTLPVIVRLARSANAVIIVDGGTLGESVSIEVTGHDS